MACPWTIPVCDVFTYCRKDTSAASQSAVSRFDIRQVALFGDHNSQVWRLSWNVTGTILCSSGDDGFVRLWKGVSSLDKSTMF